MDRITATVASIGIAASLVWSVVPSASEPVRLPSEAESAIVHEAAVPTAVVDAPAEVLDAGSIVGGTADDRDLVESSLDRYREAGLELPVFVVTIDRSMAACKGHNGLYRATGTGDEIGICHPSEYVVLHELAHAWEHHALEDAERAAYVVAHDLPSWSDSDTRWRLRGIEHIANTLAAALGGDGAGCTGSVADRYASLTGLDCTPDPIDD